MVIVKILKVHKWGDTGREEDTKLENWLDVIYDWLLSFRSI